MPNKVNSDFTKNSLLWHFRTRMVFWISLFLFFSFLGTVSAEIRQDCPDRQVLHVDSRTKQSFCCIPVPLFKGEEFVSCHINGTRDSTRKCPEGLFQEDETTTSSEATCIAEVQCIAKENQKIKKCDAEGENCVSTCVCNYPEEFCGPIYYDCKPFPDNCPKEYVNEDCSCSKMLHDGLGVHATTNKPGYDVTSQKYSAMPSSSVSFVSVNTTQIVQQNNNGSQNNSTSGPGLGQDESGLLIPVLVVSVLVIVALVVLLVCCRGLRCLSKKCQKTVGGHVVLPSEVVVIQPLLPNEFTAKKPTAEIRPWLPDLAQQNCGAQSFYMYDESGDAQDAQNVDAQRMPSVELPIDGINEAHAVPFEEPPSNASIVIGPSIEGWVTLSTIPSNSYDSDNTSLKQIESDQNCDNTAVKQVEDVTDQTERMEAEETQLHDIVMNPQSGASGLPSVDSRFQSGNSGWSSFGSSIDNRASDQIVDHPCGD